MKVSRRSFREVGRYQWFLLCVFTIAGNPGGWENIGILFMAPKLEHWCKTNFSSLIHMNSTQKEEIISKWPKCKQPDIEYWLDPSYYNESSSEIQWTDCSEIEFKKSLVFEWTVTEKYELGCDREWFISLGNTIYMCGFFVSAVTGGSLADRFGRRKVLLSATVIVMASNILVALSPVLELYFLARFLLAGGVMTLFTTAYILIMELLRKDQRILPMAFGGPWDFVASAILPGVATLINNFEHFCYLLASIQLVMLVISYFAYPESPRWLASRQRFEEAEKVVEWIAKINKQKKEELAYMYPREEEKRFHISPLDLFRTPLIRKRTLILWLLWLSAVFINYGILYNLADFGSEVRISIVIMAVLDFLAWLLIVWEIEKFGRQASLFVTMLLAGVCCLAMAPLVHDKSSPYLTALALIGKTLAGNIFFIVYQHTPELYPTVMRTMGLGASSTVARVAGMVAPLLSLLNVYWPPLLVVILGLVTLLATSLVPFIPDTTGYELAQTIDEGENFLKDHGYKLVLPPKFTCCKRKVKINKEDMEMNSDVVMNTDL